MSYKGKVPHHYDRSSRSFQQGAWKNWPYVQRQPNGLPYFPYALMKRDEELLANRQRRQLFTTDAPRFKFNGQRETAFRKAR